MKCPLLSIACAASRLPLTALQDDCLEDKCAWWILRPGHCAMVHAAVRIRDVHEVLLDIRDKLPGALPL